MGVGMKSVTRGHRATERMSLRRLSAVACSCIIEKKA